MSRRLGSGGRWDSRQKDRAGKGIDILKMQGVLNE